MLAHFAKEKNAIGATQRAHPEAVEYAWVGKAPVAPCQEAREIGIEIAGAEALCSEYRIAPQQDAAVPDRLVALFGGEMRCDLRAPFIGKRPSPGLETQIERADAMNDRKRHAARFALFRIHARRLVGLLDIFVGECLAHVDIGLGNFGRTYAEHREHRVRALR